MKTLNVRITFQAYSTNFSKCQNAAPTLCWPILACVHLSSTPSVAPLTNSFGPVPSLLGFNGMQYEDMDLRSRENSNVNSFFHLVSMSWRTTMADVRRSRPCLGTLNGFSFSASTMRAVSVASPTCYPTQNNGSTLIDRIEKLLYNSLEEAKVCPRKFSQQQSCIKYSEAKRRNCSQLHTVHYFNAKFTNKVQ